MRWIGLYMAVLLGLSVLAAPRPFTSDRQPRIWLTPAVLSALRAKAASADPDWLRVKARADHLLRQTMPRYTVIAATNSSPVQVTIAEPVPWTGSVPVFVAGGAGGWARMNTSGDRPRPLPATRVGTRTFSLPVDARAFGSFTGQRLALFFSQGGHSAYGYNGSDWQSTLETLGVAYRVTGDEAYAAKGAELIDYIGSLGVAGMLAPAAIDSGFPSRSAVHGLAIGYDWLEDRLSAAQKAAAVATLNLWFDWFRRAGFENAGPAYGNYFGGHLLGYGLAGFATEADNPRGREIVGHMRGLFETHVAPAFVSGGFAGGHPPEGYLYGAHHFQRLLYYMLAVESATGTDLIVRSGYPQRIARTLLHAMKPNLWQVSDEGAWPGDHTGVLPPSLPIVLSALLAGTEEGRWMQHLQHHLATAPGGGQAVDPIVRLLFLERGRPAADYRATQPTWFRSPGDDHLYRRSDWGPDAVWTSMAGGTTHWAGHQMRGAGHVAIQRGDDYLLVNSGQWKGATGESGTPQASDLRSWRANTLFLDDFGDYMFDGADYLGGQATWGESRVLAHDGSSEFGYMKADLTTAYSVGHRKPWAGRSLRSFHRSFLSMGNGVVLVFDRMRFLDPLHVKKLYFHLNPSGGPPAISAGTASIRAGRSSLFIRALLPAGAGIAAAADPLGPGGGDTGTYRVEISAPGPGTTFDALTVLVATASSVTSMPPAGRLRSIGGAMVGAMVRDGGIQRVGLFAADGTPQERITYRTADPKATPAVHVLTDIVPRTRCGIRRDGAHLVSASASSQGVLVFRAPAGGLFAVRCQAVATGRSASLNGPPA